jgi:type IV pilus assembly protein PilW
MKHPASLTSRMGHRRLSGFTLIELMIAITLAIFLVGGLLMMVQSTRNTVTTQTQLAQLQDNERLVLTFMTEVIESTGYYPQPQLYTAAGVMPPTPTFVAAGQAVFGTGAINAPAPGDTVYIRYGAALNDNVFNCRGTTNTTVGPYDTFVNKFWIDYTVPANPILTCTFSSGASPAVNVPLVNGVTNMSIQYGIKRNVADTGSCADTYLPATLMLATDWSNVCSISLTVTFANPINPAAPIQITRVIAVMNTAGVNT